ncbi:hypothetical protein [Cupriavidus sp. DL-D2]|uniref:hypothetical protein n=1 Tax=Cupriavidus sp. DL-D2 TaxID=3144974 RepID=UPI003213E0A3
MIAIGSAHALWTWPADVPNGTPWFWVRVAAFPALAGMGLFGLRLMYFEQETERLEAEEAQWKEDHAEALRFAQEPLAVIDVAYLCAFGGHAASARIAEGSTLLQSQKPKGDGEAVRCTTLPSLEGLHHIARFEAAFVDLLDRLDSTIHSLAGSIPLEVYLQLPEYAYSSDLLERWQVCWNSFGYRPVQAALLSPQQDLMETDAWLDTHGGPALEKFALFVSVQLHVNPQADSAEAAVAVLLGWAPLAQRKAVPIRALWHRPIEAKEGALRAAMSTALQWGNAEAKQVTDIWQAGLTSSEKPEVLKASSDLELASSQAEGLSGVHDIDLSLGNAGCATAWLAAALAIERAAQTGTPQLVVTRQQRLHIAVVQTLPTPQEVEHQA